MLLQLLHCNVRLLLCQQQHGRGHYQEHSTLINASSSSNSSVMLTHLQQMAGPVLAERLMQLAAAAGTCHSGC
jgi:hypothetical protein